MTGGRFFPGGWYLVTPLRAGAEGTKYLGAAFDKFGQFQYFAALDYYPGVP
jgi:hypothetical protein